LPWQGTGDQFARARCPERSAEPLPREFARWAGLGASLADRARLWTQDVPLTQSDISGPVNVTLKTGSQSKSLRQAEDIAIRATMLPVSYVSIKAAPLVFIADMVCMLPNVSGTTTRAST
jgi:hypothetical protein